MQPAGRRELRASGRGVSGKPRRRVGWVEPLRNPSRAVPLARPLMGFATLNPSYMAPILRGGGRFHENRAKENREMSWAVRPVTARSARISPITGANLKPCPEHGDATMIWGHP